MSKSNFSLADHYRHGVYVQDTPFQKMIAIGYIFVAVILNLLLLLAGWTMSNGVILSIPPSALKLCLGTILELTLLILSLMWVAVEFVKIRAPITATGFTASLVSSVGTPIDCIVFSSDINFMSDRTYPTIESIEGTMNLMMSKSLGCLRSTERCFANKTQFLFGPQLVGADEEEYVIQPALALIHTNRQANSSTVTSTIILVDPRYCIQDQFPVCDTSIRDIQDVDVITSFETDGSTASIALVTGTAFSNAVATIIPSEKLFTFVLTGFLEASFLGDSRNSSVVKDIQQLEPAMEALYSVILRAGIQRSFDSKGKYCPRYYIRQDQMLVFLNFNGSLAMFLVASIQLILSFISLMLATCWIFCPLPLSPAIRTVRDPKYFLTMIATSSFAHLLYGTANAPVSEIWSRLNVNARIGEPFYTVDDEVGIIVLGRPDEVQPIQNDRKYR
ncbi:hypothetical protein BDR26DRAFT_929799 [Obelidium mucronatum]|nr:hypothetical protein BDR26DRAFT_929799 [Obelidium mucronatum]